MFPFRLQNKSGGSFYGTTTLHCIGFLIFPASFLLLLLLGLTFLFSLFQLDVQAVKDRNPISDDTRFLRIIVDTAINHVVILLCARFLGTFCGAILQKFLVMQQFRLLFSKKLLDFLHNRTIKSVNRLRHLNSAVVENNVRFLLFCLFTDKLNKSLLLHILFVNDFPCICLPSSPHNTSIHRLCYRRCLIAGTFLSEAIIAAFLCLSKR